MELYHGSFDEAVAACRNLNGFLPTIHDDEQQYELSATVKSGLFIMMHKEQRNTHPTCGVTQVHPTYYHPVGGTVCRPMLDNMLPYAILFSAYPNGYLSSNPDADTTIWLGWKNGTWTDGSLVDYSGNLGNGILHKLYPL